METLKSGHESADVLIVGGGPVGLASAILLHRAGVSVRVIEKRRTLHQAPQAHVVSARTMEILTLAGIEDATLRAVATRPEDLASVLWTQTLAGPELGRCNLATPERLTKMLASSPSPMANISQHRLEPILLDAVLGLGVAVDFAREWCGFENNGETVVSATRSQTGPGREIRSRFVLGCDGAGSPVRKAMGVAMEGPEAIQTFVNIHFEANLRELVQDRPGILYWHVDPEEPGVFIAHDIDSTWVYMHALDGAQGEPEDFDEARCRALLGRAIGCDISFEIKNVAPWTMTAQVASRYRDGSLFLLGDAAHRFPPTGGLGMNTGIADAANLAWKIAAVCDDRAATLLLDTYEEERRPVAERNTRVSLQNWRKMGQVEEALDFRNMSDASAARARLRSLSRDPARQQRVIEAISWQNEHFDSTGLDLGQLYESGAIFADGTPLRLPDNPVVDYLPTSRPGARLPHAWLVKDGMPLPTLALADASHPVLLTGSDGDAWRSAATALDLKSISIGNDGDVQDPGGEWATRREVSPEGAILLRPDGHIAWRAMGAAKDPCTELRAALAQVLPGPTSKQKKGNEKIYE